MGKTQVQVSELRAYFYQYRVRDRRNATKLISLKEGKLVADDLVTSLCNWMRYEHAGYIKINPDLKDDQGGVRLGEPPVIGTAKFYWNGHWYLWNKLRPHLREALELGTDKPSLPALRFRECLWEKPPRPVGLALPRILPLIEQMSEARLFVLD